MTGNLIQFIRVFFFFWNPPLSAIAPSSDNRVIKASHPRAVPTYFTIRRKTVSSSSRTRVEWAITVNWERACVHLKNLWLFVAHQLHDLLELLL